MKKDFFHGRKNWSEEVMKITREVLQEKEHEELIEIVKVIQSVINEKRRFVTRQLLRNVEPIYIEKQKAYIDAMRSYTEAIHPSMKRKLATKLDIARKDLASVENQFQQIQKANPTVDFFNTEYTGPIG